MSSSNDFDRYRRAKAFYGRRLDRPRNLTRRALLFFLVLITATSWYFAAQGYYRGWIHGWERTAFQTTHPPESDPLPDRPGLVLTERRPEELAVVFLDVGQGDAIYLQTPGGTHMLVDTGQGANRRSSGQGVDAAHNVILPFFRSNRVPRLNLLITTHPQQDHIGAAADLLQQMPVDRIWTAGVNHPTPTRRRLLDAIRQTGTDLKIPELAGGTLRIGQRLPLDRTVKAWLVHADPTAENMNNASLSILIHYGQTRILLPGDAEREAEREMVMRWGRQLDVDVLKIAHHGSQTSTSPSFLDLVQPEHSVIMAGRRNPFGHPDEKVLRRLEESGSRIHRTDLDGTIYMFMDGRDVRVLNRFTVSAVK